MKVFARVHGGVEAVLLRVFDQRRRVLAWDGNVPPLASARAILGQRAVRADDRVGQAQVASERQRGVGPAPGDKDDPYVERLRPLDGGPVCRRDIFGRIEERAVEVEGDELDDGHPPSITRGVK
jgi:hypothetical protein